MYFTSMDIQQRRDKLSVKWNAVLKSDEVVVVCSGEPIQKPGGLDQMYTFIPHPAYFWLTGRRREEEVIIYNKNTGWQEFQKQLSRDQMVWEGDKMDLLVADAGNNIHQLSDFLNSNKFSTTYRLGQTGEPIAQGKHFELRTLMDQTRRKKDAAEVKLIRHAADIAVSGYNEIYRIVKPGVTEKEIQVTYESEIFRRGAHTVPYDSIVGSGTNSAILHALPTSKIVEEHELVLVDAGVDIFGYCVDITRVFASSENMPTQHKLLYELVLKVQKECVKMAVPGVYWRDVHSKAATMFTEGLMNFGILKGNLSQLIEKEVVSVFFPHGLGHLVGLHVRDTGHEENLDPKLYFGARLRVDIRLEEGHLITAEPGLYFIKSLLATPETRSRFKDDIIWPELDKWMHIGGIRIEDNILITNDGNENLTVGVEKKAHI